MLIRKAAKNLNTAPDKKKKTLVLLNHERITCHDRNCQRGPSYKVTTWQQPGTCQKTYERPRAWRKEILTSDEMRCCVCWNWAELINRLTPSIPQSAVVVQLHTWPKRTGSVCQRSKGTMQGSKHKPISRRAGVLSAKGLRAGGGATNFSSNRTQTCCQVNVGAASQKECEGPWAASNARFDSQRKSVEWLEDWAVSAKSKCAELMQMFPKESWRRAVTKASSSWSLFF